MSIFPQVALIAIIVWAIQVTSSYSQTLFVYVRPPDHSHRVFLIGIEDKYDLVKIGQEINEAIYNLDLSSLQSAGAFSEYDVVVKDAITGQEINDLHIQFPLRLDIDKVNIWMIVFHPEPSKEAIEQFSLRGLKRDKAYQTYFEARSIYKIMRLKTEKHYLIGGAAYWYFAAAYEMAKPKHSVVLMDEKSIKAVEKIITRAENDKRFADALINDLQIDLSSLNEMIKKAKLLNWNKYGFVREASNRGDYKNALAILGFYEESFEKLSDEERKKVIKEYGVNFSLIKNDKAYLETVVSETQQ